MLPKHSFKLFFFVASLLVLSIDLSQMTYFIALTVRGSKPVQSTTFNGLAISSQYGLFALNALAVFYFYRRDHLLLYVRKVLRHYLLYLFAVIFTIRFCDLFFNHIREPRDYIVHFLYLLGVFVKHFSRLIVLQMACFYRFAPRGDEPFFQWPSSAPSKSRLVPINRFLLYVSPNTVDIVGNLVRLSTLYVFLMATAESQSPLTRGQLVIFVGEMLYYFYNCLLISAFLLKWRNPRKDVLRFVHKQSNEELASERKDRQADVPLAELDNDLEMRDADESS